MHWLNIHASTLDGEEFIGSEPTNRATWLCLMRYCVGQENGGRIRDSKQWSDRKWQQLCRVTKSEVEAASLLWEWEGNDLIVFFYPTSREAEVKQKREAGRRGGISSGKARAKAPREADAKHEASTASQSASTEREREREDKGKGTPTEQSTDQPTIEPHPSFPRSEEAAIAAVGVGMTYPRDFIVKTWHKANGRGGTDSRDVIIRNWSSHLATEWGYEQDRIARGQAGNRSTGNTPAGVSQIPLWQQIKSTKELIEDVNTRIARIHVPDGTLYPADRAAALKRRAPLVQEKADLVEKLATLNRLAANGGNQQDAGE